MNSLQTEQVYLEQMMPVIKEKLSQGNSVRLAPRGVSMLPMLRQGIDSVILSPLPDKLKKFDLPLYQRANGHYVLHRIVKVGESYTCIGDNQSIFEKNVNPGQMIALVTAFYRGDRLIKAKNPLYRFYCWFWYYSRPVRLFWRTCIAWLRRHIR